MRILGIIATSKSYPLFDEKPPCAGVSVESGVDQDAGRERLSALAWIQESGEKVNLCALIGESCQFSMTVRCLHTDWMIVPTNGEATGTIRMGGRCQGGYPQVGKVVHWR